MVFSWTGTGQEELSSQATQAVSISTYCLPLPELCRLPSEMQKVIPGVVDPQGSTAKVRQSSASGGSDLGVPSAICQSDKVA